MDIADQADMQNELAVAAALKQRKPEGPAATGFCHNCRVALAEGVRYCDAECMKDHQTRLAAARRRGERGSD